ncbi:hypothetical protein G210_1874, partial [Candida maltosa Xu316]
TMFTQLGLRSTRTIPSRIITRRNFQVSARHFDLNAQIYGHAKEGVYSNLPFKVKGRKFIPFRVWYWGVMGFFFAFPFLTSAWQMYKGGAFRKSADE